MTPQRNRGKLLRTTAILTAIALLSSFAFVSTTRAYGSNDNWQLGFAGTFVHPGGGNTGFWGWCAFAGISSGTDGDCQVSNYFHSSSFSFTCQTAITVTGWKTGSSAFLPPFLPGFFITSGQVTAHPSSALCLELSFPPGVVDPSTGAVIVPFDTGIPAAPGHYNLNPSLGGMPGELQIQVTFLP